MFFFGPNRLMTISVVITADGVAPVEIAKETIFFNSQAWKKAQRELDLDLGKWNNQLVRLDIKGEVKNWLTGKQIGFIACQAELKESAGSRDIKFASWHNPGFQKYPPSSIGSRAFIAETGEASDFVYGQQGALWHVLRVPKAARTPRERYLWEMISENWIASYETELAWVRKLRKDLPEQTAPA